MIALISLRKRFSEGKSNQRLYFFYW